MDQGVGEPAARPWDDRGARFSVLALPAGHRLAVNVSLHVVRTFVRLRQLLATHAELARRLDALERKYDGRFQVVFAAIRELMAPDRAGTKRRIGFHSKS